MKTGKEQNVSSFSIADFSDWSELNGGRGRNFKLEMSLKYGFRLLEFLIFVKEWF